MFRSSDLAVMFAAFGVAVQFGGSSAMGIFDQPTTVRLDAHGFGGIETDQPSLKLPANAFNPMPKSQDNLTVDGVEYAVMSRTAADDAAIMVYALKGPI